MTAAIRSSRQVILRTGTALVGGYAFCWGVSVLGIAVSFALGGAFHAKRLQLVSSQVGQVSPSRRPRFDYARRTQAALALLADERLDALISEEIGFRDAPARLPALFAGNGITAVLRY